MRPSDDTASSHVLTLWADAICINQRDPIEKASQVAMMDKIYSFANKVIADLGEDADHEAELVALPAMERYWKGGIWRGSDKRGFGRKLEMGEVVQLMGLEGDMEGMVRDMEGDGKGGEEEGGKKGKKREVKMEEFTREETGAVLRFFERPWFRRVWVMQEFVLAREVVLLCGRNELDWKRVWAGCMVYDGMPMLLQPELVSGTLKEIQGLMSFGFMTYVRRLRELRRTEDGIKFLDFLSSLTDGRMEKYYGGLTMAPMLHYLSMAQATLGRDRYFALLSMAADIRLEDHPELRPDYTAPDEEIVRRFGRVLIKQKGGVEVFLRAGLWRKAKPELPSWVEDATLQAHSMVIDFTFEDRTHKAAGDTEFVVELKPQCSDAIMVKGSRFETIEEMAKDCKSLAGGAHPYAVLLDYIRKGSELFLHMSPLTNESSQGLYPNGEDIKEAAALTLCTFRGAADQDSKTLVSGYDVIYLLSLLPEGTQTLDKLREVLEAGTSPEKAEEALRDAPQQIHAYSSELGPAMNMGLVSAMTQSGYFATVPPVTRLNDEIWIIQGCRLPVVLRRNEDARLGGEYRLVGACYVHGIMDGEALQRDGFEFVDISMC